MKSKKFVVLNVIIICWALFLGSFAFFSLIPGCAKAPLICNGMPEIAVRLIMGKPDEEYSMPSAGYGMPSGDYLYYDFGSGQRMRYVRCSDVFEIPLLSGIMPEIRITWVTHLVYFNLIRD